MDGRLFGGHVRDASAAGQGEGVDAAVRAGHGAVYTREPGRGRPRSAEHHTDCREHLPHSTTMDVSAVFPLCLVPRGCSFK